MTDVQSAVFRGMRQALWTGYGLAIVAGVSVAAGWHGVATTLSLLTMLAGIHRLIGMVALQGNVLHRRWDKSSGQVGTTTALACLGLAMPFGGAVRRHLLRLRTTTKGNGVKNG